MYKIKKYQFELLPNEEQRQTIHKFAGAYRYIFNKGLDLIHQLEKEQGRGVQYRLLHLWLEEQIQSKETSWLTQVPRFLLENSLADLIETHKNSSKNPQEPIEFRKKGRTDSFCFTYGAKLDCKTKTIYLPEIGRVKFLLDQPVQGVINEATLSRKGHFWFIELDVIQELEYVGSQP